MISSNLPAAELGCAAASPSEGKRLSLFIYGFVLAPIELMMPAENQSRPVRTRRHARRPRARPGTTHALPGGPETPETRTSARMGPVKTAAQILQSKPDQAVQTIAPAASVFDAVKLMAEKNIGALLVMEGERIIGIVSERDYARKTLLMERSSRETSVRDVMTSEVMYVRPGQTSEECMVLMTENRVRHLPVIDGERLIGLISIGDLVKDIISEQRFIIDQLEHYIRGER